jgi:hypothetical protein
MHDLYDERVATDRRHPCEGSMANLNAVDDNDVVAAIQGGE